MGLTWAMSVIIILALTYDFFNGANDRPNVIATTVYTRAMTPLNALLLATIGNFIGAFLATKVATTVGKGIVSTEYMTFDILASSVLGATLWSGVATKKGWPVSITHSLVGGLMGGGIAGGGPHVLHWNKLAWPILPSIIIGPLVGVLAALIILWFVSHIIFQFKRTPGYKMTRVFKVMQIISAGFVAVTHGMNDTQNAIGVITAGLVLNGSLAVFEVQLWVQLICASAMAIGTFLMGWKVMHNMGHNIAELEPRHGFVAETAAATIILIKSWLGIPASTTHIVGSAVTTVGMAQGLSGVNWEMIHAMVRAWIFTIPCAGASAYIAYQVVHLFMPLDIP
jgi:inorganic phosphate transporter, PiT family